MRVEGGANTSSAWDIVGALWAWGNNGYGQLGDGTTTQRTSPVSIAFDSVLSLHGGSAHTISAKADGSVWTWGLNDQGQLGDGTTTQRKTPTAVVGLDSVVSVSASGSSSVAVSSDGRVWTWGDNYWGQLGDGTHTDRHVPVQLSDSGFAWRVATPSFSQAEGTYNSDRTVAITCATPAATIHYTTTGIDPTESDPTIASGGTVSITQTTTLKAKAWLAGMPPSNVNAATYTLVVGTPSFSPGAGTYTSARTVTISSSTTGADLRYTLDGSTPTADSTPYTAPITINTRTTLKASGFKAGWTPSAVTTASYSFNYGTLLPPVLTPGPSEVPYGQTVTISAEPAAIIRYTTNGTTPTGSSPIYAGPITVTGTTTIYAKAFSPDWTTSAQAGGAYTVKVGSPVLTPGSGAYAPGQLITLTDTTPGAVIHYTTNGAPPTLSDPVIASGDTIVAGNYTVTAQAFLTGWTSSDVVNATYAITGPLAQWAVAAGYNHSIGLKDDGTVWTWGRNGFGELGNGTQTNASTPGIVSGVSGVTATAAGGYHTLALTTDGIVWAWGFNANGQLGDGSTTNRSLPVRVSGLSGVVAIAAGAYFSMAVKSDGSVWAWGQNSNGQLGDGTTTERVAPVQVLSLTGVVAIVAGDNHALAKKDDGSVWGWGKNSEGELGDTTVGQRLTPVPTAIASAQALGSGAMHSFAVTLDGALWSWGSNTIGQLGLGYTNSYLNTPAQVVGMNAASSVDGGNSFSLSVTTDGTVWSWGSNTSGVLGDGTTTSRSVPGQVVGLSDIRMAVGGAAHSVAVSNDGAVWAWGGNTYGQLGDGTLDTRMVPTKISEAGFAWKTSTPRLAPGTGTYTAVTTVTVTAVTPGAEIHYTTNGADPTQADVAVASGGTVTIDSTVTLKAAAWKVGMPASNVALATYAMSLAAPSSSPGAGLFFSTQTVALSSSVPGATIRYTTDGSDPDAGSAVYSSPITVDATTTIKARALKTGWTDSAISTATYTLKAITPIFSPIGGGFGSPQVVTISTATPSATIRYTVDGSEPTAGSPLYSSPMAVSSTTSVKAIASRPGWVDSDSGAASFWITEGTADAPTFTPGAGAFTAAVDVAITTAPPGAAIRFTVDGSDPTPLSTLYVGPFTIDVTTTVKARAYKRGYAPSAVASAAYAIDAAGAADTPTLTPGGGWFATRQVVTVAVQAPDAVIHYTTTGADPTETDPVIASGSTLVVDRSEVVKAKAWSASLSPSGVRRADYVITGAIAVGEASSYALKADGTVWAWGDNLYGQLGDGTYTTRLTPTQVPGLVDVVAIAAGAYHVLAVKADGTVWAWGRNISGQLGDGTTTARLVPTEAAGLSNVVAVAAGEAHSLALRADGSVWAWGANGSGQLGDGTTTMRTSPVPVPGLTGVSRLAAGQKFSLALEDDGTGSGPVWAWGLNANGQLGDGSLVPRLLPVQVSGITDAVAIAAGQDFAFAIERGGTLWAWGHNSSGQLGDATTTDRLSPVPVIFATGVTAVAAGPLHSVAATNDGRVWTWGSNTWQQLGDDTVDRNYPQAIGGVTALTVASGPSSVHTVALQPDGTVMSWGGNGSGQLGDGTTTLRPTPVSVSGLSVASNDWLLGDPDGDRLVTWREYLLGTDPLVADTNRDGVPDGTAVSAGVSPTSPDADGDGVPNWVEIAQGTDPFAPDTDGDGVPDGVDCFPLDPTRSTCLVADPNDHVPPIITLIEPVTARRIQ